MISFSLAVLTVVAGGVTAGYAGSHSDNDLGYGGSGDSHGYGYSGSFSGSGPPPNFAFPSFDFPGFLGNYIDSLSRYHEDFIRNIQNNAGAAYGQPGGFSGGYGGSYGGGSDGAYGGSFSGPGSYSYSSPNTGANDYPERVNFGQRGSFGTPGSGAASSSASVGPGGVQQTASVYPQNPNSPNVNTRFAATPGGGGFRSVFTSSESHTNNVGGKPITVQRAQTTVNDNGKVTTYTVKNP